jgi:tRNA dimethylallyltransferase
MNPNKKLVVIQGPTAIGKTELAIQIAQQLRTEIVSADSRQVYRQTTIGTAVPTPQQLAAVPHHLVQHLNIDQYYNVSLYEQDALQAINQIFEHHDIALLVGGSGLYIDVVCHGIDQLPDAEPELRDQLAQRLQQQGLENLRNELRLLDPQFYAQIDPNNTQRILKALEVCYQTGQPYSSLRTGQNTERPFRIQTCTLDMPREILYQRIDRRVLQMLDNGLEHEARQLLPHRHLNSLNTVGYKELFAYLDNQITLTQATELIQRNTRRFAKRQITWFKRKPSQWFAANDPDALLNYIRYR